MTTTPSPAIRRTAPRTAALARALPATDAEAAADLLFLEAWEMRPGFSLGAAFRAQQLRRANPVLAAQIRDEVEFGRTPDRIAA